MPELHEFPVVCFDPDCFFLPGMDRHVYADQLELERLIEEAQEVRPCAAQ